MNRVRAAIDRLLLAETVTNDLIYLKQMLDLTDEQKQEEAARFSTHGLHDWMIEHDVEITPEMQEDFDNDEPFEALEKLPPATIRAYGKSVEHELARDGEGPPSLMMDFRQLVRNEWMIHFSDEAYSICGDGFTSGVAIGNEHQLALSTHYKETSKTGGYNFAYLIKDFDRYGRQRHGGGWKYGKEAVMFQASGALVYHWGDEEPQVIFISNTARNIVYLYESDGQWAVGPSERPVYRADKLEDVVYWVAKHFDQYRKVLTCR
jgi:hypothetical protein